MRNVTGVFKGVFSTNFCKILDQFSAFLKKMKIGYLSASRFLYQNAKSGIDYNQQRLMSHGSEAGKPRVELGLVG